MKEYVQAIDKYRELKEAVEKVINLWKQVETNIGLDEWGELTITNIEYRNANIIAKVIEENKEGYCYYNIPENILFDKEESKKWIKDQLHKKIIGNNKYIVDTIDDNEYEIEKLKNEIEELKRSYIDIDNLNWDEILTI